MTQATEVAPVLAELSRRPLQFRLTAFDGSSAGPADAAVSLHVVNERGLSYLLTAPGDLGLARAYVSGDLEVDGIHPGDPYELMVAVSGGFDAALPPAAELIRVVQRLGWARLLPPAPPPEEHRPQWRRAIEGTRHSRARDAAAIRHHYDVSNRFYELVLGPSMTYTCAVYPEPDATLEQAQAEKYDLVARKLGLERGMRLLDVGCGWGGMVLHAAREYGVEALGVTLSRQQAEWGTDAIERDDLGKLAEVRRGDYRDVRESDFDAISSIGLTEHVGLRNYPAYFGFLLEHLRPGGRLLNHCITRHNNRTRFIGAFIDRYVFPDGELTGSGRIITAAQDAGLEVRHEENLREHYALTLAAWCRNLVENWDECVAEVGAGTARVWGLYMAGSRLSFERNQIQLHQVLASRTEADGTSGFGLRPTWAS